MTALLAPRNLERGTTVPNRLPAWPRILLAGVEKSGKSYSAAEAANSDLIGRTLWLEIGEDTAHEYGSLGPYEIVPHNSSYADFLDAVRWAVHQPRTNGKPNLIVVDSVTMLWELLCDEQAIIARRRATERGVPLSAEVNITADQWNKAKERWRDVINTLKHHDGPVLFLSRLDDVVVFDGDKPTRERTFKVKTERSLPYEATAVIQLRARDSAFLTAVRSLNHDLTAMHIRPYPGFTVDKLLRDLGMDRRVRSTYIAPNAAAYVHEQAVEQMLASLPVNPSPDDLARMIKLAHRAGDPEALRRIGIFYGREALSRKMITSEKGETSVTDAIDWALNSLARPAPVEASTSEREQAPPKPVPNTEQLPPSTPEATTQVVPDGNTPSSEDPWDGWNPSEEIPGGGEPADHELEQRGSAVAAPPQPRRTGPLNPQQMLEAEAAEQARALGRTLEKHMESVLPPGGSLAALPPVRLQGHIRQSRPLVIRALREKGLVEVAQQYEQLGDRAPVVEAAEILAGAIYD
ncbi:AAA family ATPase [Kitasatospora sp. NPDC088548]|uniref:AAA family ATPase n=1 Tax=Kitasatospora sp. NPDC088548 TaxID=3364075 RepID=UPI0038217157